MLANDAHFKGDICIYLQKNHHFICLTLMISNVISADTLNGGDIKPRQQVMEKAKVLMFLSIGYPAKT